MVIIYTHLSVPPLWLVVMINMLVFATIMCRMFPTMVLNNLVPKAEDRGAYMSVSASLQQTAGGLGSIIAGMIVYQSSKNSPLGNFDILGYVVIAVFFLCIYLVRRMSLSIKRRADESLAMTSSR